MKTAIREPGELVQLREAGRLAWSILRQVADRVAPGTTSLALAGEAERLIAAEGCVATSREFAFKGGPPFPHAASVSVNEEAMYGVPGGRALRHGDAVTIDLTLLTPLGWHADVATTVAVGEGGRADPLVRGSAAVLDAVLSAVRPGVWWSEVMAHASVAASNLGLHLLPGICAHGIGREMHELPWLFHARPDQPDVRLRAGMVLAIEPVVLESETTLATDPNGWTLTSPQGVWSAFEERMVAVTEAGPQVLTD